MRPVSCALFAPLLLAFSAGLLFARLGHYALWDDEAGTALTALGVLESGDTSAVVGRNLFACEDGAELEGTRLRYMPPGQAYLAAPFLAAFGRDSALAARLPFALCALAAVALMLAWLERGSPGPAGRAVFAAALLTNASFFLFGRQARYYAPVLLLSAAAAWLYARGGGARRTTAALAGVSCLLLGVNYLAHAALYACLAADYALWGRRERRLSGADWAVLLVPQAAAAALLLSVWNPFGKQPVPALAWSPAGAAASFAYALRDLHRCEFLSWPLVAAAPLLYLRARDPWLLRAPAAILVYAAAVAVLAPLPAAGPRVAQVRYLVPLIPLGVAVAVLCARALPPRARGWGLAAIAAVLLLRAPTAAAFVRELASPPGDPYRAASAWIRENAPEGASVWATPGHAAYPLMFHAPNAVYAWQLPWPPRADLAGLDEIHFRGRAAPDYAVVFGPGAERVAGDLNAWQAGRARYERAAVIDAYWRDLHRPELFWRSFVPVTGYDREREAIVVLRRVERARGRGR